MWYKLCVSLLYAYTVLFALLGCFMFSAFLMLINIRIVFGLGVVHNYHHFHERTQRTLGGVGQGRSYAFLNVVYSDGNEIIVHVRRTSMTKNPRVRNSLLVQKLVT